MLLFITNRSVIELRKSNYLWRLIYCRLYLSIELIAKIIRLKTNPERLIPISYLIKLMIIIHNPLLD